MIVDTSVLPGEVEQVRSELGATHTRAAALCPSLFAYKSLERLASVTTPSVFQHGTAPLGAYPIIKKFEFEW